MKKAVIIFSFLIILIFALNSVSALETCKDESFGSSQYTTCENIPPVHSCNQYLQKSGSPNTGVQCKDNPKFDINSDDFLNTNCITGLECNTCGNGNLDSTVEMCDPKGTYNEKEDGYICLPKVCREDCSCCPATMSIIDNGNVNMDIAVEKKKSGVTVTIDGNVEIKINKLNLNSVGNGECYPEVDIDFNVIEGHNLIFNLIKQCTDLFANQDINIPIGGQSSLLNWINNEIIIPQDLAKDNAISGVEHHTILTSIKVSKDPQEKSSNKYLVKVVSEIYKDGSKSITAKKEAEARISLDKVFEIAKKLNDNKGFPNKYSNGNRVYYLDYVVGSVEQTCDDVYASVTSKECTSSENCKDGNKCILGKCVNAFPKSDWKPEPTSQNNWNAQPTDSDYYIKDSNLDGNRIVKYMQANGKIDPENDPDPNDWTQGITTISKGKIDNVDSKMTKLETELDGGEMVDYYYEETVEEG